VASLSITGTGDELRVIGHAIVQSAASVGGTRQVTVTVDNAASGASKGQVQGQTARRGDAEWPVDNNSITVGTSPTKLCEDDTGAYIANRTPLRSSLVALLSRHRARKKASPWRLRQERCSFASRGRCTP
jgi:hypothetical protein